jgi:hypothetical protein
MQIQQSLFSCVSMGRIIPPRISDDVRHISPHYMLGVMTRMVQDEQSAQERQVLTEAKQLRQEERHIDVR